MSKELLIDILSLTESVLKLTEEKSNNGRMRLKGKLQQAEKTNGNFRVYPKETLEREIQKYIDGPLKKNNALGELDHAENSIINLSNVSHNFKRIWWEGDDVFGELELLNTPSGKIAQELVLAGIPLGISSRGMGSVKQIGENVEVQNDYDLLCWDLVSTPSTPGAYMEKISEGIINQNNKYKSINLLITDIICSNTGFCECQLK